MQYGNHAFSFDNVSFCKGNQEEGNVLIFDWLVEQIYWTDTSQSTLFESVSTSSRFVCL